MIVHANKSVTAHEVSNNIVNEYKTVGDKKKVAAIYKIPIVQVTEILKKNK